MNIGLYFGTFNPIHVGHLVIANYMAELEELDQVWLVVSPQNPFKEKDSMLPDFQRLDLVRMAVEDNLKLKASDIEFGLPKPSYTVTTLAHLKEKHPAHQFSLIMGEDNLRSLHKWYNYEYILKNHPIFVYPRVLTIQENKDAKDRPRVLQEEHHITICNDSPHLNISSSLIRKMIAEGKEVRYLLTEPVFQYVDEMNLYRPKKG